jgi:hypothetical protein
MKSPAVFGRGKLPNSPPPSARDFEILRRRLASVRDFLVLDDLTLIQTGQTGPFDGRDVNEDIFPTAALRLNEPLSFLRIEPLHCAARHRWASSVEGPCIAYGSSGIQPQ